MPIRHVAFIMYPVTDMARAVTFYRDGLGLRQEGLSSEAWVEFDVAGTTFGVGNFEQVGTPGSAKSFAIEVADLDEFSTSLATRNVAISPPISLPNCRLAVVEDPDGNQIWFHELK